MALTYELIATASPTTTAGSFTSIPQSYTHLRLIVNARVTSAWDVQAFQMNGNPSGYSGTYIEGYGGGRTAGRGSSEISFRCGYIPGSDYSGIWSADIVDIFNYASTTQWKTCISDNKMPTNTGFGTHAKVGLWQNTSAVTSITYGTANGGTYASGTTIKLYGIKAA
jgi:hypothetical protein